MPEPVDAEDDVLGTDKRLDREVVARAVLAADEGSARMGFNASEEAFPELERLFS